MPGFYVDQFPKQILNVVNRHDFRSMLSIKQLDAVTCNSGLKTLLISSSSRVLVLLLISLA